MLRALDDTLFLRSLSIAGVGHAKKPPRPPGRQIFLYASGALMLPAAERSNRTIKTASPRRITLQHLTRRAFVSGAAALGMAVSGTGAAEGQLVWKTTDWNPATFQALIKHPARIKQVYDIVPIGGGKFLNNVKNSLNGLEFGFGVPRDEVKIAVAMHGPANMLNYDDHIWSKYQIGEWLKVTDPKTGKPAVRNIFVGQDKAASPQAAAQNPDSESSMYQAHDMATLRSRGVQFMSCHTATEEQVRALIRQRNLKESPEAIVKDMLAHTIEGTLVVASMVAAIALLQSEGRFTYITVA